MRCPRGCFASCYSPVVMVRDTPQEEGLGSDSGFATMMAHLYRGEMHRMATWRQRLDVTSNWAIILTTGLTTFTLGSPQIPHYTLLLGLALIAISVLIEGRRYRHLHHSKWRLYLIELGFFAESLLPSSQFHRPYWRRLLAADLRRNRFLISWPLAMRVRLRRNYLLLLYFISAVWVVKLLIHPSRAHTAREFVAHLPVADFIPAWFVGLSAVAFIVCATALALTCPAAERLEDWSHHYERARSDHSAHPADAPPPASATALQDQGLNAPGE
jgi:uncharacterized membrane protein